MKQFYLWNGTYFPRSHCISGIVTGFGNSVVNLSKYQNSRATSGWKTMLVEKNIQNLISGFSLCNKIGRKKSQIGGFKYNIWQLLCDTFYCCCRSIFKCFIFMRRSLHYSEKSVIIKICLINACWMNEKYLNINEVKCLAGAITREVLLSVIKSNLVRWFKHLYIFVWRLLSDTQLWRPFCIISMCSLLGKQKQNLWLSISINWKQ